MKKFLSIFLALALTTTLLVGCKKTKTTEAKDPIISGVEDVEVEFGTRYDFTQGITADDGYGNDITEDIEFIGRVDLNTVGEYTQTIKVTNSIGRTHEVTRKVTVVFVDREAPLITGAANATIIIGSEFDVLEGVKANDTVDGDLTSKLKVVSGTVNTMVPGDYVIKYEVEDNSANKKTLDRTVTVGFGAFRFDGEASTDSTVSGLFNVSEYGFCLIELTVNSESATKGTLAIDGFRFAESYDIPSGEYKIYGIYLKKAEDTESDVELSSLEVTLPAGVTLTSYIVGVPADITPPAFTHTYKDEVVYLPKSLQGMPISAAEIAEFLKNVFKIQAKDVKDNEYKVISVLNNYDLELETEQVIKVVASDNSGNVGELEITAVFTDGVVMDTMNATKIVYEQGAKAATNKNIYGPDIKIRNVAGVSYGEVEGEEDTFFVKADNPNAEWYNAKIDFLFGRDMFSGLTKDTAAIHQSFYLISFQVKSTDGERLCSLRMGNGLSDSPWFNLYAGFDIVETYGYLLTVSEEWTTINIYFHADKLFYDEEFGESYGPVLQWTFGGGYINGYQNISAESEIYIKGATITCLNEASLLEKYITSPYEEGGAVIDPVLFGINDLRIENDKVMFSESSKADKHFLNIYKGQLVKTLLKTVEITSGTDLSSLDLASGSYAFEVYYTAGDKESKMSNKIEYTIGAQAETNTVVSGENLLTTLNINGRHSFENGKVNFYYTASGFRASFTGTAFKATFSQVNAKQGCAYIVVLVDGEVYGEAGSYFAIDREGESEYVLVSGLENTTHTIEVLKRSEASNNTLTLVNVSTDGEFLTAPADRDLQILMIGASGSTGYGNIGSSSSIQSSFNSDGMRAYPYLVARMYNADITEVNASGWGMKWGWNNQSGNVNMPEAFKKLAILPGDNLSNVDFDFSKDNDYDLIMVNLGMNDFNAYIVDNTSGASREAALAAYNAQTLAFFEFLHSKYPNAKILVIATSLSETNTGARSNGVEGYLNMKVATDNHLDYVYGCAIPANGSNGSQTGSNSHANVKTHIESADAISAWIEANYKEVFGDVVNENLTFDPERDLLK